MPPTTQQWDFEEFHEPSLQYINNLLMEEDVYGRECSIYESIALQATVKGFYDILNGSNEHRLQHGTVSYGENFRGFEQEQKEMQNLKRAEDHGFAMEMRLDEKKLIPTEFPLHQDHGFVESEYCAFHMLQTTNGGTKNGSFNVNFKPMLSNGSLKQNVSSETLKQHISKPDGLQNGFQEVMNFKMDKEQDGLQNQNIDLYSDTGPASQAQITKRRYPFNRSTENSLLPSVNEESTANNSHLRGLALSSQPGAKGNNSLSSSDDDGDGTDNGYVESLSFVGNEDLKAELYAKVENEDLPSLIEKLRNSGLKTSPAQRTGKSKTIELDTTADLKNMLYCCAQAVAECNIPRAHQILREIRQESSPYGNDMQRIAHYFAEGLFARITGTGADVFKALCNSLSPTSKILKAYRMLVDVSPFAKFSHVFRSRAFLDAAKDASRLHVIDYGIWYGIYWPSVISALAERKGGPPHLRMTLIEFPESVDNPASIAEWTAKKLSEYAKAYGVPFEYHVIADKWENITASTVGLREEEVVVVHSTYRLRHVLDESVTSSNPRTTVLKNILEMNPKLFFHGAVNRSFTSPFFLPRFREALSCFSAIFNMLETVAPRKSQERLLMEREFHGRDILNVVACEGEERVERPETYKQWQSRMNRVGFVQMPLDENMVKHFQRIARTHYNKNFNVDMDENWLVFEWKGKVTRAFTLWRPRTAL